MTPPTAALPCPWCNGKTLIGMRWLTRDIPKWWGFCKACKAKQAESATEEEAIENWNRRAAPAVQATADADLIDALRSIPTCGDRGDLVWFSDIEKILSRHSAVSPKAAAEAEGDTEVTIKTTTGIMLSLHDYNLLVEARDRSVTESFRKMRAYQEIRALCGGKVRDFNFLEKVLDGEIDFELAAGIAIEVSEKDKDWVVPIAHGESRTLGSFMQKVMDEWLTANRSAAVSGDRQEKERG